MGKYQIYKEIIFNSGKCYCDDRDRGLLGATWELMEIPLRRWHEIEV